MAFQKKQWQFNDIITEGELNRIEDGIEEGIAKAEDAKTSIETHVNDKNNPHNVTPEQIGAETPAGAQAKADAAEAAAKQYTDDHISQLQLTADNITLDSPYFTADNVQDGMNELFTSVSDGKNAIAAAITDMGQSASGSDTFAQLAAKIRDISDDANASASDVLSGKTFYQGGAKRTGTMPNNGAVVITPGTVNKAIAAGYHNGSGYVQGDTNLISSNIAYGKTIFGVTGTFRGNMVKSIQTGQVSFPPGSGSSSDVTISSVNVNSSIVLVEYLGWPTSDADPNYFYGVEISAYNKLTFYYGVGSGAPNLELQWKVIEFYPEAVQSLQKGVASSSTSSVSINSVTRSKSLVIVTGGFRIDGSQDKAVFKSRAGYLSGSSTLQLTGYGSGDCRWQVIRFY